MRDRLLLPLFIPLGAAMAIFLLIYSVSRILLEAREWYSSDVGAYVATAIAIAVAVCVLGICTLLAAGPRLSPRATYLLTALPAAAIIAVGLYLAARPGEGGEGGAAAVTSFTQVATDNKFSVTEVTVPVGAEVTVNVDNQGTQPHNWHLQGVKDAEGKDIATELKPGPNTQSIKFTLAQGGSFAFVCDAHPAEMKGTLRAAEGVEAASPNTVTTTDNKFDPTAMSATANQETTITVENKGTALHNWHVQGVKDASGNDIATKLAPGGSKESVSFVIDKPGTYDYVCDAHPAEMKGKLTVQ
jgi:plastocyanin